MEPFTHWLAAAMEGLPIQIGQCSDRVLLINLEVSSQVQLLRLSTV